MRRGRPVTANQAQPAIPNSSPKRAPAGDPFAALDANGVSLKPADEIASRFPSLDQFSLLHDKTSKFDFSTTSPAQSSPPKNITQRVTEKLADDAFAVPAQKKAPVPIPQSSTNVSRAQKIISSLPELETALSAPPALYEPPPNTVRPAMVSQGTMTSPISSPADSPRAGFIRAPLQRFPSATTAVTLGHHRSSSVPRSQVTNTQYLHPEVVMPRKLERPSEGYKTHANVVRQTTASSRPSLEGGRPSLDATETISRTVSATTRPRPASIYLESNMDYLREKEASAKARNGPSTPHQSSEEAIPSIESEEEMNIKSNLEFLRAVEDNEASRKKDHRRSSSGSRHHAKRASMPSMSLANTKTLLAGKFGDAFKRFESSGNGPQGPRTPSPMRGLDRRDLTPIAGSEATDGRSDDGQVMEETDDMTPEVRRELERQRLAQEERRVATAAAEYRKRMTDREAGMPGKASNGLTRAATIQDKVKTLLDENQKTSPTKTAAGYGRYTNAAPTPQARPFEERPSSPYSKPVLARKLTTPGSTGPSGTTLGQMPDLAYAKVRSPGRPSTSSAATPPPPPATTSRTVSRPSAKPKPTHLNSLRTGNAAEGRPPSPNKPPVSLPNRTMQAHPDMTAAEKEDYIADFSKRYPSLSGIEMVDADLEREVPASRGRDS